MRFVVISLNTVQNPQKEETAIVEDAMVQMIDMVEGLKRGVSTAIKLDTLQEIVNQPGVIEIGVVEVDQGVTIVEEEEFLDREAEIEEGSLDQEIEGEDLQLEVTQEIGGEMTEEVSEMTEEIEEVDLLCLVLEANLLAQKVPQDVKITKIELDLRVIPQATLIKTVDAIITKVRIEKIVDRVHALNLEADQKIEAQEVTQIVTNLDN